MILDTFLFFNELDILEIRLNELDPVVDKFVLVESVETFSGKRKDLVFARALDNEKRFDRFRDKIIQVTVADMPPLSKTTDGRPDPWPREYFQRNATMRGLRDCQPDDIIIISDLDEIPRATAVATYKAGDGAKIFSQRLSYYFMNCCAEGWWTGTRILTYRELQGFGGPDAVRRCGSVPQISNGGWHFSYQGGVDAIRQKIAAYSHSVEFNKPEFTSPTHLEWCLAEAKDLFNRPECPWSFVPFDDTFPAYVRENREKFAKYIAPHPENEP